MGTKLLHVAGFSDPWRCVWGVVGASSLDRWHLGCGLGVFSQGLFSCWSEASGEMQGWMRGTGFHGLGWGAEGSVSYRGSKRSVCENCRF